LDFAWPKDKRSDAGQASDLGRAMVIGKMQGPILRGLAGQAPCFHHGTAARSKTSFSTTRASLCICRDKAKTIWSPSSKRFRTSAWSSKAAQEPARHFGGDRRWMSGRKQFAEILDDGGRFSVAHLHPALVRLDHLARAR